MTLPNGWIFSLIGEISESINPGFPSGLHNIENRGVPHIRPMNISRNGEVDLSVVKYVQVEKYSPLLANEVLFNNTNSPDLVGKTTYINQDTDWAFSNHMTRIRPKLGMVTAAWMAYALHYLYFSGYFKLNCRHHVNQASISSGFLAQNVKIPLPPLAEQERIIARIESLFTQLDAGVTALKRLQAALKRYRASVLKAACEGHLVPQDPNDEPANGLLRILGKSPLAGDDLTSLPKGWCWVRVGDISKQSQYGTSEKANLDSSGIPVLRMGNIQNGQLDFGNLKYIPLDLPELKNLILEDGDLIFNRTNSAELVGKTAVYKRHHPRATFASYLIRIKFQENCLSDYVCIYINSLYGRKYISSVVSQQVGQANVNGTKLANMPLPLPSLSEQRRIVAEVERRISVIQELEQTVSVNLKRAARLRQAILRRAFEGELVEQDPPLSAFLETPQPHPANPANPSPADVAANQLPLL